MQFDLDYAAHVIHSNAIEKGFYDPVQRMDEQDVIIFEIKQLAMIHSEVTEVLEALRKKKGAREVSEEMADIFIRLVDLYSFLLKRGEVDRTLSEAILAKIDVNSNRPKMHGVLA